MSVADRQVVAGWWCSPCAGCEGSGRFEMPDGARVLCWECKGMAWVPATPARSAPAPPERGAPTAR